MKCPKCQYLGFDSGERCRNCGYDFSLALDLPARGAADPGRHRAARPAGRFLAERDALRRCRCSPRRRRRSGRAAGHAGRDAARAAGRPADRAGGAAAAARGARPAASIARSGAAAGARHGRSRPAARVQAPRAVGRTTVRRRPSPTDGASMTAPAGRALRWAASSTPRSSAGIDVAGGLLHAADLRSHVRAGAHAAARAAARVPRAAERRLFRRRSSRPAARRSARWRPASAWFPRTPRRRRRSA